MPEIAVLRTDQGKVYVLVRYATVISLVRSFSFDPNCAPGKLLIVPDVNGDGASEIAMLGARSNGDSTRVIIKDSKTGALVDTVNF